MMEIYLTERLFFFLNKPTITIRVEHTLEFDENFQRAHARICSHIPV